MFLQKFFPPLKTSAMEKRISNFRAMEDEIFFICQKRFKEIVAIVGNPRLLCSHALDRVGCMQIYPKLSKYIVADKQVFKNNKDTIENINLENKPTNL